MNISTIVLEFIKYFSTIDHNAGKFLTQFHNLALIMIKETQMMWKTLQ